MATRDAAAANRSAAASRSARTARAEKSRRFPMILAGVVGLCLALALGISVALSDDEEIIENQAPAVEVSGALDPYVDGTQDLAIGQPFPTLTGMDLDGNALTISGADGPALVVYLAHWCHVCQSEVPVLRDWMAGGGASDIEVRAVSTGFQPGTDNWPPSAWLEEEGWTVPTLIDRTGTAGQASGQSAFPYFIAVDGDGEVVARLTGALTTAQLDQLVALAAGT
jgi:peroxiredoxin